MESLKLRQFYPKRTKHCVDLEDALGVRHWPALGVRFLPAWWGMGHTGESWDLIPGVEGQWAGLQSRALEESPCGVGPLQVEEVLEGK